MVISPPLVAPELDHPGMPELMRRLGGSGRAALIARHALQLPYANCYWNVAKVAGDCGGRMRLGWMIRLWPSCYLTAEHHAVWQDNGGVVWDVTATSDAAPADHTVFVFDDRIKVDLYRSPNVLSRHLALSPHKRVAAVIDAYRAKHAAQGRLIERCYQAGYRCESQFRMAAGLGATSFSVPQEDAHAIANLMRQEEKASLQLGDAITRLRAWPG